MTTALVLTGKPLLIYRIHPFHTASKCHLLIGYTVSLEYKASGGSSELGICVAKWIDLKSIVLNEQDDYPEQDGWHNNVYVN